MLALVASMAIWGTLGIFVLWSGVSALDIAFYRCLLGSLFMGFWIIRTKEKFYLNKNEATVAIASIFLVMNWFFLFKSFQISTITIGNMSYYLQPVILIILGIVIYKEKISLQQWLLISMALCGVLLTIDIQNLSSPNIALGIFYALFAASLYSFLTIFMKPIKLNYYKVIFIQLTIGTIMLIPFAHFQRLSLASVSCLVVIGIVHTLFAYYLYYKAIQKASFTQIAVASYLDPVVAIVTDVIFFNRQLNLYQLTGAGLTFVALYCLVASSTRRTPILT